MSVNGSYYNLALVVQLLRFGDPLRFLLPISREELLLHAWSALVGGLSFLLGRVWGLLVLLDALLDLLADLYFLQGEGQAKLRVDGFAYFGIRLAEQLAVDGLVEFGLAFEFAVGLRIEEVALCVAEQNVRSGTIGLRDLWLFCCRQRRLVLILLWQLVGLIFLLADVGNPRIADKRLQVVLFLEFLMAVGRYSEVLLHVLMDLLVIASCHQVKQSASRLFEHYLKRLYVLLLQEQIVPEGRQVNRVALQEFLPFGVLTVVEAPFEGEVPLCQNAEGLDVLRLWEVDKLVVCWRVLRNVEFVQDLKALIGLALLFSKQRRQLAQSWSWKEIEKGQTAKKNSAMKLSLSDFCFFINQYVLISADNRPKSHWHPYKNRWRGKESVRNLECCLTDV